MHTPSYPHRITLDGRPWWEFDDGTVLPVVHGGDGDDSTAGDESTGDESTGDDAGTTFDEAAARAKIAKANREAKNLRDRLKALEPKAAEYDKLAAASQTETERAQEAARTAEERVAVLHSQVAAARLEAALAGVVSDPAEVVADLNVAKFLDADGNVDADAVKALRDRYAAYVPAGSKAPAPNRGQGASDKPPTGQLSREALDTMSPEAIVDARSKGLLNDVLGIKQ